MAGNRWAGKQRCTVGDCDRPCHGEGMCSLHYQRRRKGTALDTPLRGSGPNLVDVGDADTATLTLAGQFSHMPVRLDVSSLALVTPFRWFGDARRKTVYAVANRPGDQKRVYMHRLITGAEPDIEVDHVDGDGLHNVRTNLRFVTRAEQMQNVCARGSTGIRGVVYNPRAGSQDRPYCVRVQLAGKGHWGGHYATAEEADAAATSLRHRLMPFAVDR